MQDASVFMAYRPIANRQEVLGKEGIALQCIHRPTMALVDGSNPIRRILGLAVARDHFALLRPNEELSRTSSCRVFHGHATHRSSLTAWRLVLQRKRVGGLRSANIPPQDLTIGRGGCALVSCLASEPSDVVYRITMGFLNDGDLRRRRAAGSNKGLVR